MECPVTVVVGINTGVAKRHVPKDVSPSIIGCVERAVMDVEVARYMGCSRSSSFVPFAASIQTIKFSTQEIPVFEDAIKFAIWSPVYPLW